MMKLQLTGHVTQEQTLTYLNLPFEVPPQTGRIEVNYHYTDPVSSDPLITHGSTIDIGIFDPRGAEFIAQGYRGWSGSARLHFFVAEQEATPGYLHGPIQAGTWHICLGLYKIPPQGCTYTVDITLLPTEHAPREDFPTLLTLSDVPNPDTILHDDGWYQGEIHCHTVHSDGDSTAQEVIYKAELMNLDFLAIMDHNNITHLSEMATLNTRLMLIPGYEVTTYHGHWNIWGNINWIDFRVTDAEMLRQAMQTAAERGYLVSCNHPKPYGPDWDYKEVTEYACVEVWNGPWLGMNQTALEFWDAQLQAGRKLVAVGGSDAHFHHREHPAQLAEPTNWVYCADAPTPTSILQAMRAGHVCVSREPNRTRIEICVGDVMMGDTCKLRGQLLEIHLTQPVTGELRVYTQTGCVMKFDTTETTADFLHPIPEGTRYIRVELRDPEDAMISLTNPIYFT